MKKQRETVTDFSSESFRASLIRGLGYLEDVEIMFAESFGVPEAAKVLTAEQKTAIDVAVLTYRRHLCEALKASIEATPC